MAFFKDTYCQLCERFNTKEQRNEHLYSSRHLHREVNAFWPAYFVQRKLTRAEVSILERAFWKMFFATRDIKEVDEFLITYFMMLTNLNDYVTVYDEFTEENRGIMEGQFEHDLYKKSFSNQLESDRTDSLLERTDCLRMVVDRGGPIPNDVFEKNSDELFGLYRKTIDPEMQENW